MIPSSIIAAEQELRRVIERRQGRDIPGCLAAYGEIAGNEVKSLLPGDPIRLQICERVLSVLEWARLTLLTRRACLADDLRLLRKTDRFLGAKQSAGPQFRLDL
jgi:hypothetical protein